MPVQIARGFAGKENIWNMGQESGFIAYIRGSIGDTPQPSETLILGDTKLLEDYLSPGEIILSAHGKSVDETPSVSESWTITNS